MIGAGWFDWVGGLCVDIVHKSELKHITIVPPIYNLNTLRIHHINITIILVIAIYKRLKIKINR